MRAAAILGVLLLGGSVPAGAEIYRWTDENGKLHFTQSLEQVPPRYRAAAESGATAPSSSPSRLQRYSAPSGEAALRPSVRRSGATLEIPFRRQGTLMVVDVTLNDHLTVPFYMDTGASGISLPQAVADQLGIRTGPDTPSIYVHTANGMAARFVVTLDSVQLGGARVENLEATVNPTMRMGLLGGTFFNNFIYRVDAAAGVISLQPNDGIRGGHGAEEWRQRFRQVRLPLQEIEAYLDSTEVSRPGRRARLQARREELRRRLEELEAAANRAEVPASWRE